MVDRGKNAMVKFEKDWEQICETRITDALSKKKRNFAKEAVNYMSEIFQKMGRDILARLSIEIQQINGQIRVVREETPLC